MLRDRSEQGMAALLGPTWQHLHVLLPELAPAHPADEGLEAPPAFEVMAAVVDVLVRERPLVLAVDDAQWADQSTLQLLRFLSKANLRQPLGWSSPIAARSCQPIRLGARPSRN